MIALMLQWQSWILVLQQKLYGPPYLKYLVSSPLQNISVTLTIHKGCKIGQDFLRFCVPVQSQEIIYSLWSSCSHLLIRGEYKSSLYFLTEMVKYIRKQKHWFFFLNERWFKFKVLFIKVDTVRWLRNDNWYVSILWNSCMYISRGLLRSVTVYRPLYHGTTSAAKVMHQNLI